MTPTQQDIALYVSGNYDGDVAALEQAIAADPELAAIVAEEAKLELVLRDAAAAATFCPACDDLVRDQRCNSCGAALRPGGYTVERVLVSNAHGRMYVAHDADGKQVALKELAFVHAPSPAALAAFEREAKFLRALSHPAIPRFVASFEEGQGVHTRYYLAQELVAGTSLEKLDDKWYSEAEILDVARQVLAIIEYLQSLSPMVIHRDIKPANLIKRADGTIALVDFGAAHVHGTTAGVTTIGTFGYMPIEQLAGIVDGTTDLYALGATLLHLLTRQEPWKLAQTKITVNVSAPLRAFLDKLTAPDPRDRFPSAKAASAALEARDSLVTPSRVRRGRSRGTRIAIAAIAGVAFAAAGASIYHLTSDDSTAEDVPMTVPPHVTSDKTGLATLRFVLPKDQEGQAFVDGAAAGYVQNGWSIQLRPGSHSVRIVGGNGSSCEDTMEFFAGKTTIAQCNLFDPIVKSSPLELPTRITKRFTGESLHVAMQQLSEACDVNIVVPAAIAPTLTMEFKDAPCDQVIEVVLMSHELWYAYTPDTKLLRVGTKKDLDREIDDLLLSGRTPADDPLPARSTKVDLDFKDASLRDVLALMAKVASVNIVVPEGIDGKVTIRMKGVPWDDALQAVLSSHELWYRYRSNGRIIAVMPRKDLDAAVRRP